MTIFSISDCLNQIQREQLNLNDYFVSQNQEGSLSLRAKTAVEKASLKGAYQTEADFSNLLMSAISMLDIISKKEIGEIEQWQGTAEKIYRVMQKEINTKTDMVINKSTKQNIIILNSTYNVINKLSSKERSTAVRHDKENVPALDRKPLIHNQRSCFVNTTLQILAHIGCYRDLLNPETNPLLPKQGESVATWKARQRAQLMCHLCISQILNGNGDCIDPAPVLRVINLALVEMDEDHLKQMHEEGGKSDLLLTAIRKICDASLSEYSVIPTQLDDPTQLQATLEQWQKQNNLTTLPDVVVLRNNNGNSNTYLKELQINGATYQLEAIEQGGLGHAVPWVKIAEERFSQINDISNTTEASQKQAANLLSQSYGWRAAHYVRVKETDASQGRAGRGAVFDFNKV